MNTDLALVLGFLLAVLSVPSMVSAYSDRRSPRVSAVVLLIAVSLIAFAVATRPGGYTLAELPDVFFAVISRFLP